MEIFWLSMMGVGLGLLASACYRAGYDAGHSRGRIEALIEHLERKYGPFYKR